MKQILYVFAYDIPKKSGSIIQMTISSITSMYREYIVDPTEVLI